MNKKIAACAALACIALWSSASARTVLTFNDFLPQSDPTSKAFQNWASEVSKATDGQVEITFPSQSVAPAPGILDAVRNGVSDGGFVFNSFVEKAAPGLMVSQMPWISLGDTKAVSVEFWNVYQQYFSKVEKLPGVKLVSTFNLGPGYLCSVTGKPMATLADLKSQRVWALPGTIADILKTAGLPIIAGPAIGVQQLASRNTIDAYFGITLDKIISFGIAPYTKSCVDMSPAMQSPGFSVFFNAHSWARLSKEQRSAIMKLSGASLAKSIGAAADEADAAARKKLIAQGVTFVKASPALIKSLKAPANQIQTQWITTIKSRYGVDGNNAINEFRTKVSAESK